MNNRFFHLDETASFSSAPLVQATEFDELILGYENDKLIGEEFRVGAAPSVNHMPSEVVVPDICGDDYAFVLQQAAILRIAGVGRAVLGKGKTKDFIKFSIDKDHVRASLYRGDLFCFCDTSLDESPVGIGKSEETFDLVLRDFLTLSQAVGVTANFRVNKTDKILTVTSENFERCLSLALPGLNHALSEKRLGEFDPTSFRLFPVSEAATAITYVEPNVDDEDTVSLFTHIQFIEDTLVGWRRELLRQASSPRFAGLEFSIKKAYARPLKDTLPFFRSEARLLTTSNFNVIASRDLVLGFEKTSALYPAGHHKLFPKGPRDRVLTSTQKFISGLLALGSAGSNLIAIKLQEDENLLFKASSGGSDGKKVVASFDASRQEDHKTREVRLVLDDLFGSLHKLVFKQNVGLDFYHDDSCLIIEDELGDKVTGRSILAFCKPATKGLVNG